MLAPFHAIPVHFFGAPVNLGRQQVRVFLEVLAAVGGDRLLCHRLRRRRCTRLRMHSLSLACHDGHFSGHD